MGLLDWLWKNTGDGVTGAAIGAALGEVVDNRRDRQEQTELLKEILKELKSRSGGDDDEPESLAGEPTTVDEEFWGDLAPKLRDKMIRAERVEPGTWARPKDPPMYQIYREVFEREKEPERQRELQSLSDRWREVKLKALEAGVFPLEYMPRSIAGDVMGTPMMLRRSMDLVEESIELDKVSGTTEAWAVRKRIGHVRTQRCEELKVSDEEKSIRVVDSEDVSGLWSPQLSFLARNGIIGRNSRGSLSEEFIRKARNELYILEYYIVMSDEVKRIDLYINQGYGEREPTREEITALINNWWRNV